MNALCYEFRTALYVAIRRGELWLRQSRAVSPETMNQNSIDPTGQGNL
jgi:hypothetical protein